MKSRWQSALAGALTLTLFPVISGPVVSSPVISSPVISSPVISGPVVSSSGSITSWFLLQRASAETQVFNALEELEKLPVKGRAPKTGYSRNQFGSQWTDTDRNGCDTRNDILKRDLSAVVFREKTRNCVVETGVLKDPYSGQTISFQRGEKTSALIQIDHVVALSNAWQTGIFQSTVKVRTNFANDPLNLMAVKGSLNSQKGDGDAATWLPPNKAFRCAYVSRQIQVKVKYGLWVTKSEKEAMLRVLQSPGCNTEVVG